VRHPGKLPLLFALVLRLASAAGIDPARYLENIKVLASEEMKGRAAGRPELDDAARYIAGQFRAIGLEPVSGGGFLQPFPITAAASLGDRNSLQYTDGRSTASLTFNEEFRPLGLSASGTVAGQVVFAGYGISAREYGYDDYAGLDVKNKLVIILRHEPQEAEPRSIFSGRVYTNHAQFESKALNAKQHGALAVLFVADKPSHPSETTVLADFSGSPGPANHGIPFVEVKSEVADRWLRLGGHSLEEVVQAIDRNLRPRSFALPSTFRVELTTDVRQESLLVNNVAGYLRGESDEYLIIGAHYDHVGLGEQFSMASSGKGSIHPGADDNASGVSGVIELARWFAGRPKLRRGILFLTFAAEEIGLLGSNHYAENPILPLGKAIAMINMDMIGRMRSEEVFVGGVNTGAGFRKLVDELNRQTRLKLESSDTGGYGSSDQFCFMPKEIPVLFFFTGLHADYHTPSDTWDKIDAESATRLVGFIGSVAERLIESRARPRFVRQSR
jgi:hypothetical protein